MLVLHQIAVVVDIADHRDAEEQAAILQRLPPHRRAGARHLHANRLADAESGVGGREAVSVGVVALIYDHDRRLGPAMDGLNAELLSSRKRARVDLACEKDGQRLDQVAAVVEARVEHDRLLAHRLAKDVLEDFAVAGVAHGADVGVTEPPVRQSLDLGTARPYPALVEELRFCTL